MGEELGWLDLCISAHLSREAPLYQSAVAGFFVGAASRREKRLNSPNKTTPRAALLVCMRLLVFPPPPYRGEAAAPTRMRCPVFRWERRPPPRRVLQNNTQSVTSSAD